MISQKVMETEKKKIILRIQDLKDLIIDKIKGFHVPHLILEIIIFLIIFKKILTMI